MTSRKVLFPKLEIVLKISISTLMPIKRWKTGATSLAPFGKPLSTSSRVLVLRSFHDIIDGNRNVAVFFRPIESEEYVKEK